MSDTVKWTNLDEAFAEFEGECAAIARGLCVETFISILKKTPQFYGRLAASWNWSVGAPVYVDRSKSVLGGVPQDKDRGPLQAFYRGHRTAMGVAVVANAGKEMQFKLGDTVYITNGADHGEGPYAETVENMPSSSLRFYNRPGRMVGRTMDRAASRYAVAMTRSHANVLKNLKIGDALAGTDR